MIVNFVFSHLGFWSGNLFFFFFLIAPFPDLCHFISLFFILVELSQMYPITINVIQASVTE